MKLSEDGKTVEFTDVAPFTGAWIEILRSDMIVLAVFGRTLHGCVD